MYVCMSVTSYILTVTKELLNAGVRKFHMYLIIKVLTAELYFFIPFFLFLSHKLML